MESLNSLKFKVLNSSKMFSITGGLVDGNRTKTVTSAQTAPQCDTCRHDYETTTTVRHDD
jgi:hypothetical protein